MRATRVKGKRLFSLLGLLLMATGPAAAEELVLKNGEKIVGTIVGYENDMFRVETDYGFALVRKDRVEKVNVSTGAKEDAAGKRKSSLAVSPKASRTTASPATSKAAAEPSESTDSPPAPAAAAAESASGRAPKEAGSGVTPAPPPSSVKVAASPPPPSRPLDEPLPDHVQEHVDGTTYVNDSFHFAMFKPPGWKVYEEVPKETGSAIMAIGTEDEQTILFIDRQAWSGRPDVKSDSAETRLRHTYQDYQKLLESPTQLDGAPALRRVFKGVIDGVEWHGISVHVAHGNAVFGIIGLTSAETFQFQQALFNKIINSFHFLTPAPPAASASPRTSGP